MLRFVKVSLSSFVLGAALLMAGCESQGGSDDKHAMHDHSAMSAQGDGEAVACDTCKITWAKSPVTNDKGHIVAYTTKKSHECPDCRAAAQNFFATGNLKHDCPTCGKDAMQKCESHISKS
jgi:hypothetical protein